MVAEKKHSIGVFGGTFDPIHDGHVRLARFVLQRKLVERVIFLPAALPPHKPLATASFEHRLAMIKAAISGCDEMAVSSLEARLAGPSYTVETLQALQQEKPSARLCFLLGADSLLELHLWYRFEELFKLALLLVVARRGLGNELCYRALRELPGGFSPDTEHRVWRRPDGAAIYYLTGFSASVSSSHIRHQLAGGATGTIPGLDAKVLAYIRRHGLYGEDGIFARHS